MNPTGTTVGDKPMRVNNACRVCRERKVRCSGTNPCNNCVRRGDVCEFDKANRKILVSERTLQDLKRKALGSDGPPSRRRYNSSLDFADQRAQQTPRIQSSDVDPDPELSITSSTQNDTTTLDLQPDISNQTTTHPNTPDRDTANAATAISNPLTGKEGTYLTDPQGRRRFLGPSSTWAYTQKLFRMIQAHISFHAIPQIPYNPNGHAFQIDIDSELNSTKLTANQLPSIDYAEYLVTTVSLHVCQLYHLFDKKIFMEELHRSYDSDERVEPTHIRRRLWYIQFLLMLACGQALLIQDFSNGTVPGALYFKRAIDILPNASELYKDSMTSMELLCAIALYLQSVDHRNSAYTYLGMAFRMATSQGLHREPHVDTAELHELERQRRIWWTIYILDRRFSTLMGAPSTIRDEDITVHLPDSNDTSHQGNGLATHVNLARVLSKVVDTVYGIEGQVSVSFLKSMQQILRSLAELAPVLEESFELQLNDFGTASRVSATLNLCYHQCVVLAVRPLAMHLIREKLEGQLRQSCQTNVIEPVKALLKTCCDSSIKSLRILSALQEQHILEMFLPFDLECLFSSTFILLVLSALGLTSVAENSFYQKSQELLAVMIRRGSMTAKFRSSELSQLQEMVRLLRTEAGTAGGQLLNSSQIPPAAQTTRIDESSQALGEFSFLPTGVSLSPDGMELVAQYLEIDQMWPQTDEPGLDLAFWESISTDLNEQPP